MISRTEHHPLSPKRKKEFVLIKDIVIPAGTKFTTGPIKVEYEGDSHYECTIGLSKNTSGSLVYDLSELEELEDHFREIQ